MKRHNALIVQHALEQRRDVGIDLPLLEFGTILRVWHIVDPTTEHVAFIYRSMLHSLSPRCEQLCTIAHLVCA